MIMTVLIGELAIKQNKALIRMFKQMKDFIVENQDFISSKEKVMDNFIDPILTVAIVDRLAHRVHIMDMSRK